MSDHSLSSCHSHASIRYCGTRASSPSDLATLPFQFISTHASVLFFPRSLPSLIIHMTMSTRRLEKKNRCFFSRLSVQLEKNLMRRHKTSLSQCPEKYIIPISGKTNEMWCIGLIWATHRTQVFNSGKQSAMQLWSRKRNHQFAFAESLLKKETKFCLRELQLYGEQSLSKTKREWSRRRGTTLTKLLLLRGRIGKAPSHWNRKKTETEDEQ